MTISRLRVSPTPSNTATITPSISPTTTQCPTFTATPTQTETPTNTPTFTPTNTITPTNTETPTETPTNTPTNTETPTPTNTETPTNTPTNTETPTSTPTNTETPTNTPTNTATQTATNTPTNTETPTQTPTQTETATPTNTATNTITPTQTPSQTPYPICPEQVLLSLQNTGGTSSQYVGTYNRLYSYSGGSFNTLYLDRNTNTWIFDTADPDGNFGVAWGRQSGSTYYTLYPIMNVGFNTITNYVISVSTGDYMIGTIPVVLLAVDNSLVISNNIKYPSQGNASNNLYITYPEICPTPTPTLTPTSTQTNTPTQTPTNTPTNTETPTQTATNTPTQTPTNTPTNTETPTQTATNTPTQTPTNTETPTQTATNTPTQTPTNTETPTNTPSNTSTQTPSVSPTNTQTPTNTGTPTNTPSTSPVSANVCFSGQGFNAQVGAISKVSGGNKLYIGGAFTNYPSGTTLNRMVRVNEDGTPDTSFNIGTGFNNTINSIQEETSTGKVYVGGNFTTYTGTTINRFLRLNSDGSRDTTFNIGTGFAGGAVYDSKIQSDGKILVFGYFTSYTGATNNGIIRLNSDGSQDTTFSAGTGFSPANSQVSNGIIDASGKILCVGQFTGYNGTSVGRIVRLNTNGSIDNTFSAGTGFNNFAYGGIHQLPNGQYMVFGDFTNYNGISRTRAARLNNNGTLDTGYTPSSINNFIFGSAIDAQNRAYIIGGFTTLSGVSTIGIGRLTSGGTYDNTYATGVGFNNTQSSFIPRVMIENSGSILWGGTFTSYSGQTGINRILRTDTNGNSLRCSLDPSVSPTPTATQTATPTITPTNTATNTSTPTTTGTNTPTPSQSNFTPLTLCVDTGGIGWNSDSDACNGFCNTQTVYVPQAGITSFQEAAITYGLPIYSSTTFITANKFNGNDKWFKSVGGGEVFQVGTDGAMSVFSSCPTLTPTATSTPTQTPTVSLSSTPATTPTNTPSNSGTPNPTPTPTPNPYCYTITSVQSAPGECFDCPGYFASTTDTFIEFFDGCSGSTISAPFDMNVIAHYSDSSTGTTFISGGTVGDVLIATSDIQCAALPACGEVASPTFDFITISGGTISECCT